MELTQIQPPQEDKGKFFQIRALSKVIWVSIPILAIFILGYVVGSYQQGQSMQEALSNTNLTVCKDVEGKVWLREDKKQNGDIESLIQSLPEINITS